MSFFLCRCRCCWVSCECRIFLRHFAVRARKSRTHKSFILGILPAAAACCRRRRRCCSCNASRSIIFFSLFLLILFSRLLVLLHFVLLLRLYFFFIIQFLCVCFFLCFSVHINSLNSCFFHPSNPLQSKFVVAGLSN